MFLNLIYHHFQVLNLFVCQLFLMGKRSRICIIMDTSAFGVNDPERFHKININTFWKPKILESFCAYDLSKLKTLTQHARSRLKFSAVENAILIAQSALNKGIYVCSKRRRARARTESAHIYVCAACVKHWAKWVIDVASREFLTWLRQVAQKTPRWKLI